MQRFDFASLLYMESNSVAEMLKLIMDSSPALPCEYPDGEAGEFLRNPTTQPMALLLGTISLYGSEDPWALPHGMAIRLNMNRFDAKTVAAVGEQNLRFAISTKPALHIDPHRMGRWAWQAASVVVGQYGGANWIWNDYRTIDVDRLIRRLIGVPGVGFVKAIMLTFLLHRDWKADIVGWERFEPPMDAGMMLAASRLGVVGTIGAPDPERVVRAYEGLRSVSKSFCVRNMPLCGRCPLSEKCPRQGV